MIPPALGDLLSQMQTGNGLSWTFAPAVMRRQLCPLIDARRCLIVKRTFEDDTREYEFVVLTEAGKMLLERGL